MYGELIPESGFSRQLLEGVVVPGSAWRSHDGLMVLSTLENAAGPDGEVSPQWHVSVSKWPDQRATPGEVRRVLTCFAIPSYREDDPGSGIARHLWCPVDPDTRG